MLSFKERNRSKTQVPARYAARPLTCGSSCCPARRAGLGGPPDRRNGARRAAGLCLHGRAVRLHAAWRHGGSAVSPASVRGLTRALAAIFSVAPASRLWRRAGSCIGPRRCRRLLVADWGQAPGGVTAELGADQVCKRPPASQRVWRVCSPWPAKLVLSCVRWLAASLGSVVSFRHSTEAKRSLAPARSSEAPANKQKITSNMRNFIFLRRIMCLLNPS